MKKRNWLFGIVVGLMLMLCLAVGVMAEKAEVKEVPAPEVKGNNVVLVSLNTGATIYEKNAEERVNPASTTKLMTMAVAVDMIEDMQETIVFDKAACYADLVIGSSNMGLKDGEKVTLESLMYGIAVTSANEGTNAVAIHLSGSIEAFVAKMNEQAEAWGMKGTHYVNTHGLTHEDHYTTAEDMAILAQKVFADERLMPYLSCANHVLPETNMNPQRTITSTNQLLRLNSGNYYKYAVAGKTGTTTAAGYNLVSMARYKGMEYACVMMNASYELDTNPVFADSTALYKWAFSHFSVRSLLVENASVYEMKVELCAKGDYVMLIPEGRVEGVVADTADVENFIIIDLATELDSEGRTAFNTLIEKNKKLPLTELLATNQKNATVKTVQNTVDAALKENPEATFAWLVFAGQESVMAPVTTGDILGKMTVVEIKKDELVEFGTVELKASADMERTTILYILHWISEFFSNPIVMIVGVILGVLIVAYIIFMIWQNKRKRRRRIARRIRF